MDASAVVQAEGKRQSQRL